MRKMKNKNLSLRANLILSLMNQHNSIMWKDSINFLWTRMNFLKSSQKRIYRRDLTREKWYRTTECIRTGALGKSRFILRTPLLKPLARPMALPLWYLKNISWQQHITSKWERRVWSLKIFTFTLNLWIQPTLWRIQSKRRSNFWIRGTFSWTKIQTDLTITQCWN